MMRLKTLAVLVVLWAFQVSIFAHLRPFGVAPDLLLVAALVGGLSGGPDYGARNGFAAGLLLDLVIPGPLGLAAGIYGAFGYLSGQFSRTVDSDDPRVMPTIIWLSAFLATIGYGFGLGVLGSEQFVAWGLVWKAFAIGLFAVPLSLVVRAAYGWVLADPTGARSEPARTVVN